MTSNKYPYISIFFIIITINIFFSIYFITIFFAGVVFILFMESLKKEYYYIFFLTVFTFLFIESIHGLKTFSLSFISLFLYYFIIPRVKHIFSSLLLSRFIFVLMFYLLFYVYYLILNNYIMEYNYIFIVNLLIDSLIVGFIV